MEAADVARRRADLRSPDGVPRATNIQVEIEDAAGKIAGTPGYALDWDG